MTSAFEKTAHRMLKVFKFGVWASRQLPSSALETRNSDALTDLVVGNG